MSSYEADEVKIRQTNQVIEEEGRKEKKRETESEYRDKGKKTSNR